ncbi:MAG: ABC transporter substrate-binding protein [Actinomycetaceae bacterium]|nr:ABC transporter substrate-binding protein [Actinomycetaceae bacterium]
MKTRLIALAAALTLTLSACGSDAEEKTDEGATGESTEITGFDVSGIEKVDEIAAMLPESVTADGKLTIGTNAYYAPAEFYAEDGITMIGYDIDLANALGNVFGLEVAIEQAEFASIIPSIGTNYEVGIASFTITEERQQAVNMIQYYEAGLQWAVPAGNPNDFDPANVCGVVAGVQTGTSQDDYLIALNENECKDNPVQIQRQDEQSRVTLALTSNQIDAMFADIQVIDYAVALSDGTMEKVGDPIDVAPIGLAVAQDDAATTDALIAALQYLMDEGYLADIFGAWGISDGVQSTAVLNPVSNA